MQTLVRDTYKYRCPPPARKPSRKHTHKGALTILFPGNLLLLITESNLTVPLQVQLQLPFAVIHHRIFTHPADRCLAARSPSSPIYPSDACTVHTTLCVLLGVLLCFIEPMVRKSRARCVYTLHFVCTPIGCLDAWPDSLLLDVRHLIS